MLLTLFALYNLFCPIFVFHNNARAFVTDVTFDAIASPGSEIVLGILYVGSMQHWYYLKWIIRWIVLIRWSNYHILTAKTGPLFQIRSLFTKYKLVFRKYWYKQLLRTMIQRAIRFAEYMDVYVCEGLFFHCFNG